MNRVAAAVLDNRGVSAAAWQPVWRTLLALVLLLTLASCSASRVTVRGSYPTPNIPVIPLSLGVYYPSELSNFIYTELNDSGKEEYLVETGATHRELFNTVLPAMFQRVVVLDDPAEAAGAGLDLVFVPQINVFQLGLPQKTRLDAYEVWIRYNMRLTQADGSHVADWVTTAYGKTTSSSFSSVERGINDAAVAALRDLASNFSLGFTAVPDVRDWLQQHLQQ